MDTERFARARLLFEQSRYDLVIREIGARLTEEPDDPEGHILLALAQNAANRPEAAAAAARAVELAPDDARAHLAVGLVALRRGQLERAEAAIRRGIELNSWSANLFGHLAAVHLAQYLWAEALRAADEGLTLDPDDNDCLNNRAVALTNLGRQDEAARTLEGALEKNPVDAFAHANRGWSLLHESQPREAIVHFRESLRLDPTSDWAKKGMLEALRARSWLYRRVLHFFLLLSRFPPRVQFALVIGLVALVWVIDSVASQFPAAEQFIIALVLAYAAFVAASWFAKHLMNVLLLFDPDGRVMLDRQDKWVSCVCVGLLMIVLTFAILAAFHRGDVYVALAIGTFLGGVHLSSLMRIPAGRFRVVGAVASVVVLGLFAWEKWERYSLRSDLDVLMKRSADYDARVEEFRRDRPEEQTKAGLALTAERLNLEALAKVMKQRAEGLNIFGSAISFGSIGGLILHAYLISRAMRR